MYHIKCVLVRGCLFFSPITPSGAWTLNPTTFDNAYFTTLLGGGWEPYNAAAPTTPAHATSSFATDQFRKAVAPTATPTSGEDDNGDENFVYALQSDLLMAWDSEMAAIASDYASTTAATTSTSVTAANATTSVSNNKGTNEGTNEGTKLLRKDFAAAWTKVMSWDRFGDDAAAAECITLRI
jgi:catalase (peroxidase I)